MSYLGRLCRPPPPRVRRCFPASSAKMQPENDRLSILDPMTTRLTVLTSSDSSIANLTQELQDDFGTAIAQIVVERSEVRRCIPEKIRDLHNLVESIRKAIASSTNTHLELFNRLCHAHDELVAISSDMIQAETNRYSQWHHLGQAQGCLSSLRHDLAAIKEETCSDARTNNAPSSENAWIADI